jgi:plastocyanin
MRPKILTALGGGMLALAASLLVVYSLAAETASKEAKVNIDNFTFGPAELRVDAGTRVTWTNRDDIPHTVVDAAEPRMVKSPVLDTGDHFEHTFATPGTFHYFCSIHPHMQGTVVVR